MMKYALVSCEIIKYDSESLKYTVSKYDNETKMVEYISEGCNCITTVDNFIEGTLEELQAIIAERDRIHLERVSRAQDRFPQADLAEKSIIDLMISDGYDPEELTYDEVKEVTEGSLRYMEFNSRLVDAYMDYMH